VFVEVILADDDMLVPFTHDWNQRESQRPKADAKRASHQSGISNSMSHLEQLFQNEVAQDSPTLKFSPSSDHKDDSTEIKACVSDARKGLRNKQGSQKSDDLAIPPIIKEESLPHSRQTSPGAPASDSVAISVASASAAGPEFPAEVNMLDAFRHLNELIFSRSKRSQMVVMNLPDLWSTTEEEVKKFMTYCSTLTEGLERVMFVHATGQEIFDIAA